MTFDPTITLGNVLTIVAALVGLGALAVRVERRLSVLETKLDLLWRQWAR